MSSKKAPAKFMSVDEQFSWRTITYHERDFIKVSIALTAQETLFLESLVIETKNGESLIDECRIEYHPGMFGAFGMLTAGQQAFITNVILEARNADRAISTYRYHVYDLGDDPGAITLNQLKERSANPKLSESVTSEHELSIRQ